MITVGAVMLLGVLDLLYLEWYLFGKMEEELEERWAIVAEHLAAESIDLILYQDRVKLEELLSKAKSTDADFTYSFIVDPTNRILAHTFKGDFPESLKWINHTRLKDGYNVEVIEVFGHRYRDFAAPIHRGELGTLRLGIRDKQIVERLNQIRSGHIFLLLPVMLIAALATYLLVLTLMKPLRKIVEGLERFEPGKRREEIPKERDDEIGDIVDRINEITERLHNTQQSLIRAEKLASIGAMASGIAHEINNPITGIQNCLKRILARPENTEQTSEYGKLMLESANHIEKTVRTLLEFARGAPLRIEPVDMKQIVSKALKLVSHKFESGDIKVAFSCDEEKLMVLGDENALVQVVVNLVINAVDAMNKGGKINISGRYEGDYVIMEIADTGIGMPEEHLKQVFEPFFTTKESGKGTGLGLAIAHRIVADHGGEINLFSKVGEGTRAVLQFRRNNPINS
ncbi:MAG: hypothetical protein Kow0090_12760 [Myxococcota bacterium]